MADETDDDFKVEFGTPEEARGDYDHDIQRQQELDDMVEIDEYTEADRKAFDSLRKRGFCVVCFTPEELQGANPDYAEERMVELGWEVIECMKEDNFNDEEEVK